MSGKSMLLALLSLSLSGVVRGMDKKSAPPSDTLYTVPISQNQRYDSPTHWKAILGSVTQYPWTTRYSEQQALDGLKILPSTRTKIHKIYESLQIPTSDLSPQHIAARIAPALVNNSELWTHGLALHYQKFKYKNLQSLAPDKLPEQAALHQDIDKRTKAMAQLASQVMVRAIANYVIRDEQLPGQDARMHVDRLLTEITPTELDPYYTLLSGSVMKNPEVGSRAHQIIALYQDLCQFTPQSFDDPALTSEMEQVKRIGELNNLLLKIDLAQFVKTFARSIEKSLQ